MVEKRIAQELLYCVKRIAVQKKERMFLHLLYRLRMQCGRRVLPEPSITALATGRLWECVFRTWHSFPAQAPKSNVLEAGGKQAIAKIRRLGALRWFDSSARIGRQGFCAVVLDILWSGLVGKPTKLLSWSLQKNTTARVTPDFGASPESSKSPSAAENRL